MLGDTAYGSLKKCLIFQRTWHLPYSPVAGRKVHLHSDTTFRKLKHLKKILKKSLQKHLTKDAFIFDDNGSIISCPMGQMADNRESKTQGYLVASFDCGTK
jgi:hypothetical protein